MKGRDKYLTAIQYFAWVTEDNRSLFRTDIGELRYHSYVMSSGTTNQVLERRVRELLLLQDTAKKVNSILDLEKLLDEIVGRVAEAFGCNRTAVLLKDDARNDLEMIALRGFSNVHLKGYRFKVGGEGMVGHVSATAKMRYAPDVRRDPYYVVSESTTLSEVDIPLISRGKLIGIFNAQSSAVDAFSPEQIDLLCALADNIAIAIENARLFRQERLEKEKALSEQAEARQIQRALLPAQEPIISGYAVDGFCLQLNAVGGDWYDYLDLGDGFWGIALGDVCGKGMAAALLMSATRSLFRSAAEGLDSPSEVLVRLNQALLKDLPEGRFVTLVYSILDTKRAIVRVANGGHPYPIFVREQTNITELKTEEGFPLGLMQSEYSETELSLRTGDRVLMYTDGAAEAMNGAGHEYGTSRLMKSLQKPGVSAHSLLTEVQEFASGGTLSDDATALVLRRE